MAGNYPDPVANRVPYDIDGSRVVILDGAGGLISELNATSKNILNGESGSATYQRTTQGTWRCVVMLATPITLKSVYVKYYAQDYSSAIEYSTNTTTGVDGTWVSALSLGTATNTGGDPKTTGRTAQTAVNPAVSGVKAVRLRADGVSSPDWSYLYQLHIYGDSDILTNALQIWHPTLDQRLAAVDLDFGLVTENTNNTKTFRIKNTTTSSQSGVTVSALRRTAHASTTGSAIQFTPPGGGTYADTQNIGTLAAGETSGVITVNWKPPVAALGLAQWAVQVSPT